MGSAFTLIGAIVSIVFGFLADRTSRKWLLAFVVLVGEIPCFLTGIKFFTQTYEQLLFLRILTGLGVGGIFPITFSLIGDYFHAHHRPMATAFVGAAWGIGEIAGSIIAGFLAGPYGWRLPFIVAAAPNFLLVPLFLLIAKEPARGAQEEQVQELMAQGIEYNEKIRLKDLKYVLTNKTNILGYLQGVPGSLPWGILPFYLIAYYEVVQGFSKEMGTTIFFLFGVGATIGGILGGWLGQVVYKKDPRYMPLLAGGTVQPASSYHVPPQHLLAHRPRTGGLAAAGGLCYLFRSPDHHCRAQYQVHPPQCQPAGAPGYRLCPPQYLRLYRQGRGPLHRRSPHHQNWLHLHRVFFRPDVDPLRPHLPGHLLDHQEGHRLCQSLPGRKSGQAGRVR